jgi:hypothetical protein
MKKKLIIYSSLLSLGLFLSTGCTKNFEKLNTDPTSFNATNFDPNYLLTTAELDYTGSQDFSYDTWRADLIYCSDMMQGTATSIGYWAGDKYLSNPDYLAAYWEGPNQTDGAYAEQVKFIVDLVSTTAGVPKYNNLYQIGRIMKVLIFERITDLYGDIPYSQAGEGYYKKILFPVYDKQKDIYTNFISELQDAVSKLNPSGDVATGDAIYKGDVAKWQRFGNTLLLRVAMRLSKVDAATAKTVVQSVIGKTMTDNGDDAFVLNDPTGGRPTVNRVSQILIGSSPENAYVKWSKTFIDTLKYYKDPRLAVISITNSQLNGTSTAIVGGNADTTVQKGQPNGYDLSGTPGIDISSAPGYTTIGDYSSPSANLLNLGAPTFILTYGESQLLLADAAERFSLGGAADYYKKGVEASMTYLAEYNPAATVSLTAADNYLIAHPYVAGETGLGMINLRYWELTCTMMDFYETWSNWRRTGYPVLKAVKYAGNATNGTIPRRFPYPLAEAANNPANYTAAHNAVPGGDTMVGRVWWDAQ